MRAYDEIGDWFDRDGKFFFSLKYLLVINAVWLLLCIKNFFFFFFFYYYYYYYFTLLFYIIIFQKIVCKRPFSY